MLGVDNKLSLKASVYKEHERATGRGRGVGDIEHFAGEHEQGGLRKWGEAWKNKEGEEKRVGEGVREEKQCDRESVRIGVEQPLRDGRG